MTINKFDIQTCPEENGEELYLAMHETEESVSEFMSDIMSEIQRQYDEQLEDMAAAIEEETKKAV